jgi:hypothetical protein
MQTFASSAITDMRSIMAREKKYYVSTILVNSDHHILFQVSSVTNIYSLNLADGTVNNLTRGDTSQNRLLGWTEHALHVPAFTITPANVPTPTSTPHTTSGLNSPWQFMV